MSTEAVPPYSLGRGLRAIFFSSPLSFTLVPWSHTFGLGAARQHCPTLPDLDRWSRRVGPPLCAPLFLRSARPGPADDHPPRGACQGTPGGPTGGNSSQLLRSPPGLHARALARGRASEWDNHHLSRTTAHSGRGRLSWTSPTSMSGPRHNTTRRRRRQRTGRCHGR